MIQCSSVGLKMFCIVISLLDVSNTNCLSFLSRFVGVILSRWLISQSQLVALLVVVVETSLLDVSITNCLLSFVVLPSVCSLSRSQSPLFVVVDVVISLVDVPISSCLPPFVVIVCVFGWLVWLVECFVCFWRTGWGWSGSQKKQQFCCRVPRAALLTINDGLP